MIESIRWSMCLVGLFALGVVHGRAEAEGCPSNKCGTNSPYVNNFPVNGANLDGEPNLQGVRLLPESLAVTSGACRGAVRLGIERGEFVGERRDGVVVCRGRALIGAWFSIEMGTASMRITIDDTRLVRTWDRARGRHRDRAEWVRAYRLRPDKREVSSVCRNSAAWVEELQLEPDPAVATALPPAVAPVVAAMESDAPMAWEDADDLALLVVGELYDGEANVVELPRRPDGSDASPMRWFNIACQGGAIAKMRLLGYDPTTTASTARRWFAAPRVASTRAERQSTLKMITGKFCSRTSYTTKGASVIWTPMGTGASRYRDQDVESDEDLEAYWGAEGAVCLSMPRVPLTGPLECVLARCSAAVIANRQLYWVTRRHVDRKGARRPRAVAPANETAPAEEPRVAPAP